MAITDIEEPLAPRPMTSGATMGAASRISVAVTGALATIIIARILGPSGSGGFAVAMTIVYVLIVLTTFGVEHGVAYYVSGGVWGARHAFKVVNEFAPIVGVLGAALGILARLLFPGPFGNLSVLECALAAAALPFALAWFYGSFVALADNHYEGFVLAPAVQSATVLLFVVALAIPFGLIGAIVALLLSHIVAAAVTFFWGRHRLSNRQDGEQQPGQLRRALRFGVKGYAGNALQVLNYRVDVFILSAVTAASVVGYYSVAVGVTTVLWLLPQSLSDVLFPRVAALSASEHRDAEHQRDFVEMKSLRHATIIVTVGALVLALASIFLIVPIYGAGFKEAIPISLIRLPGVALIGIGAILSSIIVGRGRPEYGLYSALISTPITMALYFILIPRFDAQGAAVATTISFTLNFVLAAFFYHRITGRNVLALMIPTRSEFDDYRLLWPQVRRWGAIQMKRITSR